MWQKQLPHRIAVAVAMTSSSSRAVTTIIPAKICAQIKYPKCGDSKTDGWWWCWWCQRWLVVVLSSGSAIVGIFKVVKQRKTRLTDIRDQSAAAALVNATRAGTWTEAEAGAGYGAVTATATATATRISISISISLWSATNVPRPSYRPPGFDPGQLTV